MLNQRYRYDKDQFFLNSCDSYEEKSHKHQRGNIENT